MLAYRGTFVKKDGSYREMVFCRLEDIDPDFIESQLLGTGSQKNLEPDSELVWDLEADNWRIFNWATVIDEVEEFEIPDKIFAAV